MMNDTSFVLDRLLSHQVDGGIRYCFFCGTCCINDNKLSDHVRSNHRKEIRQLSENKLDILCFHSCPFCPARFYAKQLLPHHLIQDHCDSFSQLFKRSNEEHIRCPFCEYKILTAFENLLSHHVDECHMIELEQYLTKNHSVNVNSGTFLLSFCLENDPLPEYFDNNNYVKLKGATAVVPPITSTPKSQRKVFGDFRCTGCKIFFTKNSDLVLHIKQRHSALKSLMNPLYGCGECDAAFYKNSFIKRHRRFHHTFYDNK